MKLRLGIKTQKTLAIALPIQWVVFQLISLASSRIETVYSNGIFQVISKIQKVAFAWIPFSLGQFVFYALLIWFIWLLIKSIRVLISEKNFNPKTLLQTFSTPLALLSVVYFSFMMLWGLNYSRISLAKNLDLTQEEIQLADLKKLAEELIKTTNSSREKTGVSNDTCMVLALKNKEYFTIAKQAYENLAAEKPLLKNTRPSVKAVAFPQLMSLFGLGGIYFPFTGEANVNMHQPDFKLPFTICHEMAHQVGIGSEAEANFVAYLACKVSDEPVFNYSGNLAAMRYVLHSIHRSDSTAFYELIIKCDKGVLLDLEANTLYWERFETPLNDVSRWFNNLYLKSNGQKDGVLSYGKMVELMVWEMKTKTTKSEVKKYIPKPKTVEKPKIETVALPYNYTCKALRSVKLDSTKKLFNQFVIVKMIEENKSSIVFNQKASKYQLLITNNEEFETQDICYNNPFGKVVVDEKAKINADLSIEINAIILDCTKINDSLTVCDSIFDKQFYGQPIME